MLRVLLLAAVTLSIGACDSRVNPLNWFGGDREERITLDADASDARVDADGRSLAADITQLFVEQTTSGAIVRATGVVSSQGYFDAELVLVERTETTIVYDFRVAQPNGTGTAGPQEITVATELTVGEMAGIRTITVVAQNNRRSVGRR